MRRLNLSTALTIAGDATSGAIAYSGLTSPTVTEIGDNPDVTVSADGSFTLADSLADASESVTVKVQDAAGYFIQGPVNIVGNGAGINYMTLGMNLGWHVQRVFVNICDHAEAWRQDVGTGAFTQDQGLLTPAVGTDIFRADITTTGYGWQDGTYTVYNPDGCEIAIATLGRGSYYQTFTTATEFTCNINYTSGGGGGVYIYCRGGLTNNNGNLAIVHANHLTQWAAGNPWHPDFMAWHDTMGTSIYRFMDWLNASQSMEQDWTDRNVITKPFRCASHMGYAATGSRIVPWELLIDLCNRTGRDAWINIPARATADYLSQLKALWGTSLTNDSVNIWPEYINEPWNTSDPWYAGTQWCSYRHATKKYATVNAGPANFTLASHGLSNGQKIVCFDTPANRRAYQNLKTTSGTFLQTGYYLRGQDFAYIKSIDANTFEIYSDVGLTTKAAITAGQVEVCFVPVTGTGAVTADLDGNYALAMIDIWDAFDAAKGVDRIMHIVGSQAAGTSHTTNRFANSSMAARAYGPAVAPYFNGEWWAGKIAISSNTLTPTTWAYTDSIETYAGVYAAGSPEPTISQIQAGTGTGYVGKCQSVSYSNSASWSTGGGGLTGIAVSNGSQYDVYFVWGTSSVGYWSNVKTVTASATPSSQYLFDKYESQRQRMLANFNYVRSTWTNHYTASGGKPVVSYEIGIGFESASPNEVLTLVSDWYSSVECGDGIAKCLSMAAATGQTAACYFGDVGYASSTATAGIFSLADRYTDVTDERFLSVAEFQGRVRQNTSPLIVSNINATQIKTAPSYPHTVCTFPDATLTYSILKGNYAGNYSIVGNELRLIAGNGVDWAVPVSQTITIFAENSRDADAFNVSVPLGDAWYEGDAKFAWSSITDTDNANINPIIGAAIPLSVGSGATIASGLWDMGGTNRYLSTTGNPNGLSSANPFLVAAVIDRNTESSTSGIAMQFGNSGLQLSFSWGAAIATNFAADFYWGTSTQVKFASGTAPTGKHVYWAFWDGTTCHAGYDQIENTGAATAKSGSGSANQYVNIGGAKNMKFGSVQVVNRSGMTLSDALAMVAEMQTYHSIP